MTAPRSERLLLFLVGAVQFVNILDFMMVMPLGPDFARELGIDPSRLGIIGGSYTAAAAVSGIVSSFFLDRFDRRSALAAAMLGLAMATLAGAAAVDFPTLVAARVLAGCFGGPASAVAMSIVADAVPLERRGRAMGAVMGAFAVASVLGVPMGLEVARLAGWRAPFVAVASASLVITAAATWTMPSMRGHLARLATPGARAPSWWSTIGRPPALVLLLATATAMFANFSVIPNLAAYIQFNLGYPRDQLGILYLVGGICSFVAMRIAGPMVDRWGSPAVSIIGSVGLMTVLTLAFLPHGWVLPILPVFAGFMLVNAFRVVAVNTLASKVPSPDERARFMSAQSATSHMASACGAMLSSVLLTTAPDGALIGMADVAKHSIALTATLPFLLWWVDRRLRRERETASLAASLALAPA